MTLIMKNKNRKAVREIRDLKKKKKKRDSIIYLIWVWLRGNMTSSDIIGCRLWYGKNGDAKELEKVEK